MNELDKRPCNGGSHGQKNDTHQDRRETHDVPLEPCGNPLKEDASNSADGERNQESTKHQRQDDATHTSPHAKM